MSKRIKLSATAKGSLGEDQDFWALVVNDAGKTSVEHEWSHRNAYRFRVSNSGKNQITVDHFLSGDYNSKAQQKLRQALARVKKTA